jgi:hypothetical protein
MKKRVHIAFLYLYLGITLISCGPSQAELDRQATEIAASIFATQTAEAPTPTPTFTPTPTHTPTPTSPPLPVGWQGYSMGNFFIALPERWELVDVEEEGIEAIIQFLELLNSEWAQNSAAMFTAEGMQDMMRFWAMDPQPAGPGYASANLTYQALPIPIRVEDLCTIMPSIYDQMGIELLDAACDLEINGLETARITIRLEVGVLAIREYQYIYLGEDDQWTMSLGVGEAAWSEYEPIFITIAESFRVE